MCAWLTNAAKNAAVGVLVCASLGCTPNYYGYTKEQWHELTYADQVSVKAKYERDIDAKRNDTQPDPIADDRERLIRRGLGMNPEHAPY